MKKTAVRLCSALFTLLAMAGSVSADVVTRYTLSIPRYFKDDAVFNTNSVDFVSGARGEFVADATSEYVCNDKLPEGYYAAGWQLDTPWGAGTGAKTVQTWGAANKITVSFDSTWAAKYGKNLELAVRIVQKTYTVAYDANGGTWSGGQPAGGGFRYWDAATAASAEKATREGFSVAGWNTAKDGSGTYVASGDGFDGSALSIAEDGQEVTLYAQWQAETYSVSLVKNGGTCADLTQYTYGTETYLPADVTKTGHAFGGWFAEPDFAGARVYKIAKTDIGPKTYYAKFTPNAYVLSLQPGTGIGAIWYKLAGKADYTSTTSARDVAVDYGTTWQAYATAATGYAYDATSAAAPAGGTMGTGGARFAPVATPRPYALELKLGTGIGCIYYKVNGADSWSSTTVNRNVDVDFGSTWYAYATAAAGYAYDATSAAAPKSGTMGTAGATFECAGKPNAIAVTYKGNGATSGATSASTFKYDELKSLTRNGFVRAYKVTYDPNGGDVSPKSATATYAFTGWNNAADGTGAYAYADEEEVTNPCGSTGDAVSLYAQWQAGEVELLQPTRAGHEFTGWHTVQEGGVRIGGGGDHYSPTNDVTLYAQWTGTVCTVTFDPRGGTGCAETTRSVPWGGTLGALPEPQKDPYAFKGWYDTPAPSSKDEPYTQLSVIEGDLTLYAKWSDVPVTYAIAVRAEPAKGGSASGGGIYEMGATVTISATPSNGYGFVQWQDGTAARTRTFAARADGEYVAKFEPGRYTLKLDPQGGGLAAALRQKDLVYGEPYGDFPEPTPATAERTFLGWFTAATGGTRVETTDLVQNTAAEQGLYAQWTDKTYTVTYEPNGGTDYPSVTYRKGDQVVLPTDVTRSEYDFLGWYDNPHFLGARVTRVAAGETGDRTFYAQWQKVRHALVYAPGDACTGAVYRTNYARGTHVAVAGALYRREGYAQWAWSRRADGQGRAADFGDDLTLEKDETFYPCWSNITYTVAFDGNGGTGDLAPLTTNYNAAVTLPTNGFMRANHTFLGWATRADGPATYAEKQVVSNLTATAGATVTLYAAWRQNEDTSKWHYTIHFSPGADVLNPDAMTNLTVLSGTPVYLPPCAYTNLASAGWKGWIWGIQTNETVLLKHSAAYDGEIVVVPVAWKPLSIDSGLVGLTNANLVNVDAAWLPKNPGLVYVTKDKEPNSSAILTMTVNGPGVITYKMTGKETAKSKASFICGSDTNQIDVTEGCVRKYVINETGLKTVSWRIDVLDLDTTKSAAQYVVRDVTWTPYYTNQYAVTTSAEPAAGGTTTGGGTCVVGTNATLTATANPGYTFVQWSDGSTNAEHTATIYGDITNYVAQFKQDPNQYYVVFDGAGATNAAAMAVQTNVCGTATALAPNRYVRPGHAFDHWVDWQTSLTYADGADVTDDLAMTNATALLRAVWTPRAYAIAFDGCGGTGTMATLACAYDAPAQLPTNAFAYADHLFAGWATAPDGPVAYADGERVCNLAEGGTVTLYAVWHDNPKTALTVKVAGNTSVRAYSGCEQTVSGYVLTIPAGFGYEPGDVVPVGTAVARGTAVGRYPMGLAAESFSNRNERFAVTFDVTDGRLDITAGALVGEPGAGTVAVGGRSKFDATVAYDGVTTYDTAALSNAFVDAGCAVTNVAFAAQREGPWQDEPPMTAAVGTSVFWYRVSAANYAPFCHEVRVTVTPRDIACVAVAEIPDQTWTGHPVTPAVEVTDAGAILTDDDYTVAYADNVEPGEATVTLTGQGNYTGIKEVPFDIVPQAARVTVTGAAVTNVYDGTAHAASGYAWTSTAAGYTAADFACTGKTNVAQTAVGTARAGLGAGSFENRNAHFAVTFVVARDISSTVTRKTIDDEPAEKPAGWLSAFDTHGTYDGRAHALNRAALTNAFAEAGYAVTNVTYALAASGPWFDEPPVFTDAGTYACWYRVLAENCAPFVHAAEVAIAPRAVTLTSGSQTWTYDGAAHTCPDVSVGGAGFADGEGATYAGFPAITEVGVRPNAFAYALDAETEAGNYAISCVTGTLAVTARGRVTVTVTGHIATNAYDGAAHRAAGYDVAIDSALYTADDFTFTGTAEAVRTNAGETRFGMTADDFANANPNFTDVAFVVRDGAVVVTKARIAAEPGEGEVPPGGVSKFDVEVAYDRAAHTVDAAAIAAAAKASCGADAAVTYGTSATGPWSATPASFGEVGAHALWYRITSGNYETYVHEVRVTVVAAYPVGEVGCYFGWTLADMNLDVTGASSVKAVGLPAGLKLKKSSRLGYYVEGVPTATAEPDEAQCAYLRVTYKVGRTKVEELVALPIRILAASARVIEPAAVLGEAYGPESIADLWPEVAEAPVAPSSWSFTGLPKGLKYAKGTGLVYGTPTKAGSSTVTATRKVASDFSSSTLKEKRYAAFLTLPEAGCGIDFTNRVGVAIEPVAFPFASGLTGLPKGLKFRDGVVSGTPKAAGLYTVTVRLPDRSKELFFWQIDPHAGAGVSIDLGGSAVEDGIVQSERGEPVAWTVSVPAGARVSFTGLPKGLKYKSGMIAGAPNKVGNYVATVKTTLNGVKTTQRFAVTVYDAAED